jgi:adenylyltransferase/sulfurtransferase
MLTQFGSKGQERLLSAKVLIIGAGGLGSAAALYLAACGIGRIGIVDSEKVELNNLQRQILHSTNNIGKEKTESAKERINELNPNVDVVGHNIRLVSTNVEDIIKDYDIIADCSDSFPTRYLVNDACIRLKKPLCHGGVLGFDGQAITILPRKTACYRCLFPEPPPHGTVPSCHEAGILGTVAGVIVVVQANEVIKYILDIGNLLAGRLLIFNGLDSSFRQVKVSKAPNCPICK